MGKIRALKPKGSLERRMIQGGFRKANVDSTQRTVDGVIDRECNGDVVFPDLVLGGLGNHREESIRRI